MQGNKNSQNSCTQGDNLDKITITKFMWCTTSSQVQYQMQAVPKILYLHSIFLQAERTQLKQQAHAI